MLGLLAALAVLSVLILVGFVFRPTPAQLAHRADGVRDRESERFAVLGAFPRREATEGYDELQLHAAERGIAIDWDRARRDWAASPDPKPALAVVARRQL